MMMSMAGKKGSMQFSRCRRDVAILPALRLSLIVRCDPLLRIETAGTGFIRARNLHHRVSIAAD
jgi:hypothetical protein